MPESTGTIHHRLGTTMAARCGIHNPDAKLISNPLQITCTDCVDLLGGAESIREGREGFALSLGPDRHALLHVRCSSCRREDSASVEWIYTTFPPECPCGGIMVPTGKSLDPVRIEQSESKDQIVITAGDVTIHLPCRSWS